MTQALQMQKRHAASTVHCKHNGNVNRGPFSFGHTRVLVKLLQTRAAIQSVKEKQVEVNRDIRQWSEEMNRRMHLLKHVDSSLCDQLKELDVLRQKRRNLSQQIDELTTAVRSTKSSEMLVRDRQKEKTTPLEEETELQSHYSVPEERQSNEGASSGNVSAGKAGRKRGKQK